MQRPRFGDAGQLPEHFVRVSAQRWIGAEHAEIGIEPRRAQMVVAGAQVNITPQLAGLAPHYQAHLGVGFVADHTVDHMRPRFFEPPSPVDIGLFVKARHQFHCHRHFLAAVRRRNQQFHQFGIRAGAVNGLLDGHHISIVRGRAQKIDHRFKRGKRLVQQNVAVGDGVKHLARAAEQAGMGRLKRRKQQISARTHVRHLHQARQIDRAVHPRQIRFLQFKLLQQVSHHMRRAILPHFEPHRIAKMALRQFPLQGLAQIGHFLFIDEQITVARDAERMAAAHLDAGEQFACIAHHHRGQQDEFVRAKLGGGQRDHARQHTRRLHNRQRRFASKSIGTGQFGDDVQTFIEHARKRVRRVQPDRGEHRQYLFLKIAARPRFERRRPLRAVENADAGFVERRQNRLIEQRVLARHQVLHPRAHCANHVLHRQAIDFECGRVVALLLFETGKTHLVKLVEVRTDNAQKTQPLQQRDAAVLRLRQHAFIKRQHAELAVKQRQAGGLFFLRIHAFQYGAGL